MASNSYPLKDLKVSESKSLHQNDIGLADVQEGDDINIDMRHGEDEDDDDLQSSDEEGEEEQSDDDKSKKSKEFSPLIVLTERDHDDALHPQVTTTISQIEP